MVGIIQGKGNRDSSVGIGGIVTSYGLDGRGSIPDRSNTFFSTP
jgi:hypothetical protein